jgi:hypothetical protein
MPAGLTGTGIAKQHGGVCEVLILRWTLGACAFQQIEDYCSLFEQLSRVRMLCLDQWSEP